MEMMPLDRNESYWLLDDELVEAAGTLGVRELSTYPDYAALKHALASYAGVSKDQLLVTPGSDAAIEHIARSYAGSGGKVLLPVPTFYGYETILDRVGAETVPIAYEEREGRFVFPVAKTIEMLKSNAAGVLFLCHPNNPLGCPLSRGDIEALVEAVRGSTTLVVSDEAYFEFSSGVSFLPYLALLPNLVIIRSLSKSFALSGARVGYAIAAPSVVKRIEQLMLPWPVAHPSAAAALTLLAQADKVEERRTIVLAARDHFAEMLSSISGVVVYPSKTNFVLVRVAHASRVRDELLEQNIRVALGEPMSHFPEAKALLKDTLRIAVPAPYDLPDFITVLSGLFTR